MTFGSGGAASHASQRCDASTLNASFPRSGAKAGVHTPRGSAAAFGLTILSAWLLFAPPPALGESSCAKADALLNAGLLPEATVAYQQVRTTPNPDPCVARGLAAVQRERVRRAQVARHSLDADGVSEQTADEVASLIVKGREDRVANALTTAIKNGGGFALARALKLAGYLTGARDVLGATIAADPSAPVPEDLQGILDAGLHLDAALALSRAGLDTASRAELELALKEDPTIPVPDELASPTRREWWWNSLRGAIGPWLLTAAEITIGVLAALALLLLLARLIRRFRVRTVVEVFTGRPDTDSGAATAAAVRETFARLSEQTGGRSPERLDSSAGESLELPTEVTTAYTQAGVIWKLVGLLDRLFPSRKRLVAGYLRPRDPVRGAGITVTYGRRYGRVFDEVTVWERDYGPLAPFGENDPKQPAYDRLAVPVAAWVMYQTGNWALRRPGHLRPFSLLGTKRWESYAHFAIGAGEGDPENARRRYLQALRNDPKNRGARFNLAVIEFSRGDRKRALPRLAAIRKELKEEGHPELDSLWYRVRYMQAVMRMRPCASCALSAAVDLCATLRGLLEPRDSTRSWWQANRQRRRGDRNLHDFLGAIHATSLTLLANALIETNRALPAPRTGRSFGERLTAGLREAAHDLDGGGLEGQMTHSDIVQYVKAEFKPLGAGANYNLACYYTRDGNMSEARRTLHDAVEVGGPRTGEEALADPDLENYFENRERWTEFKVLIEGLRDPDPTASASAPSQSPSGRS